MKTSGIPKKPPNRRCSRRCFLGTVSGGVALATAGCLSNINGTRSDPFDSYEPTVNAITQPDIEWNELGELSGELHIYSGRDRTQIQPLFDSIEDAYSDLTLRVRYGTSSGLVGTIEAEGSASDADIFYTQDAATLAALKHRNRTKELPDDVKTLVPSSWRDPEGTWTGVSGRVRSLIYNTSQLTNEDLPDNIFDVAKADHLTGEIGLRPTSGSFQAFATAMRTIHGDDRTRDFFETLIEERELETYQSGTQIVDAVARGQIALALDNQYYLSRYRADNPDATVSVTYTDGDVGSLFNVSGCAIIDSSAVPNLAAEFIRHVLAKEGQRYFVEGTREYPVREDVEYLEYLPRLEDINPPEFDLNELDDLERTIDLLRESGFNL